MSTTRLLVGTFAVVALVFPLSSAAQVVESRNPELGIYKLYMNGTLSGTTSDISRRDALNNCTYNAKQNPLYVVRCTWNDAQIYLSPITTKLVIRKPPTDPAGTFLANAATTTGPFSLFAFSERNEANDSNIQITGLTLHASTTSHNLIDIVDHVTLMITGDTFSGLTYNGVVKSDNTVEFSGMKIYSFSGANNIMTVKANLLPQEGNYNPVGESIQLSVMASDIHAIHTASSTPVDPTSITGQARSATHKIVTE